MLSERIKELCAIKGISIAKLEKELGFGNGSLMKNRTMLSDRLESIANYFGTTTDYLLGREDEDYYYIDAETREYAEQLRTNSEMKLLFDAGRNASKEDLEMVANLLMRMKKEENNNE